MSLKLDRAPDRFSVMSTAAIAAFPKFVIAKVVLHIRKCKVNTSVLKAHMELLTKGETVKYPLTRVKSRFNVINQGVTEASINFEQNRQLPTLLMVGIHGLLLARVT